jgi:hypothetical protein
MIFMGKTDADNGSPQTTVDDPDSGRHIGRQARARAAVFG